LVGFTDRILYYNIEEKYVPELREEAGQLVQVLTDYRAGVVRLSNAKGSWSIGT